MPRKLGSLAQSNQPHQNGLTHSIPRELHEQFQRLLLSWPRREKQGKITIPWRTVQEAEQKAGSSWEFVLEDQFGDKAFDHNEERMVNTYPTRKQKFFHLLGDLVEDKKLQPEAIFAVLNEAVQQETLGAISGRGIDWLRHTKATYSRLGRKSEKIRQSLKELAQDPDLLWPDADAAKEFVRQSDALLDSLGMDLIMSTNGPVRRPGGAGRPKHPWIGEAKTQLRKLEVSHEQVSTLLSSVGLLEFCDGVFQHDPRGCTDSGCPRART